PAPRSRVVAVAAVAALAAVLFFVARSVGPGRALSRSRRSIAVLGFKNLSGKPSSAWLSTGLSEMLTTEISAGEELRTIPGENVARMKVNLSLADSDAFGTETLARIRKNIGSDLVVLGSYFAAGPEGAGKVRLDLRVQDTKAG